MNRKNSLRSIDWWSFHSYATSPSRSSPEERKLNYGKRVCTPGSATSNGYISRTKHRRRGPPRLSNVLRSSPSFKTIPSSIGSEFAFAASRNGQTNQPTNRLAEANFIGRRLKQKFIGRQKRRKANLLEGAAEGKNLLEFREQKIGIFLFAALTFGLMKAISSF